MVWEYKIISTPILGLEAAMNKLGKDGWELVLSFNPSNKLADKDEFVFKRSVK